MWRSTAITEADVFLLIPDPLLATVRRFEAVGFRAWPAAEAHFDGTWLIRLTPGNSARRLNSVNPLDARDISDFDARIARARTRFERAGRPLTFRMSPLSGERLSDHLDRLGWAALSPSVVMRLPLDDAAVTGAMDHIPLRDVGRFAAAAAAVRGASGLAEPGLAALLGAIEAEPGLFVLERDGTPLATVVCVHDGELAGLFEVATASGERGKGHARGLVLSALKWARLKGAREAWLQVEADNRAARRLYASLGFRDLYRYHYRQPVEP